MVVQTWGQVLLQSFQDLWVGVVSFVPSLVVAILIFVIGWIVASIVGRVLAHLIGMFKLDSALRSAGLDSALHRAGMELNSGLFIGQLVRWFIIVVFLIASLQIVGLTQVNEFLRDVVLGYLPNVIVAALILLVAGVVADVMQRVVMSSAKAAQIESAGLLGSVARWSIWILAIITALAQLGIAPAFMQILFTGIVAMLALAGGLAFGLGGREAAGRYIEKVRSDIAHR
ncbi:MAG: hypothetical protein Q8Q36_01970 [bacterium]|nr:hypothetical protein [bacterium]